MIQSFDQEQLDKAESILEQDLIESGVNIALVVDMAGHIVAHSHSEDCNHDVYSLAALAAG